MTCNVTKATGTYNTWTTSLAWDGRQSVPVWVYYRNELKTQWRANSSGVSSVACWVYECVCEEGGVLKMHSKTIRNNVSVVFKISQSLNILMHLPLDLSVPLVKDSRFVDGAMLPARAPKASSARQRCKCWVGWSSGVKLNHKLGLRWGPVAMCSRVGTTPPYTYNTCRTCLLFPPALLTPASPCTPWPD